MKMQVRITGPKVHGVGYRLHLLDLAIRYEIDRMSLDRLEEEGVQEVIALVEEDEDSLLNFMGDVAKDVPEKAEVSGIEHEPYQGYVSPIMATSWKVLSQASRELGPV